ncbi:MAG: helix-turn-helix transcriptional regulator, partial [Balneola sp.]
RRPEYWVNEIQNELYYVLKKYMDEKNYNQTQLAKELGFSKGYISQILNGNFNFSLTKMVELLLSINRSPSFEFTNLDDFISIKMSESNMKILEGFQLPTSLNSHQVEDVNFKPLNLPLEKIPA